MRAIARAKCQGGLGFTIVTPFLHSATLRNRLLETSASRMAD